ncbi:hypothetical protein [Lutimaribacter saemankumensis]|uniref:Coiled coil domain-containing protein n=1 Tax=Lutimaribacter saemankumensis TaxID=490829 RepID=A0A1G8P9Y0_9RHOB|nr:hypothetical protein [Lutimaribacter saemankumensis]SDI89197.1 hypothetical protein SAMN05421850_106140 [Lutimaribacter saemankumensis]|tara:strand:- start:138 stop:425 length:288 start_codon:yes stop_codon:yes gene_type:complete
MSERDAYIQKAKAQLDQWNAEIDKLEARAREASADGELAYRETLHDLRGKRDALEQRIEDTHKSGEAAWSDMRAGMDAAWKNLSEALEKAQSRFG